MVKATLTKEITIETPNAAGIAANVTQLVSNQAKANIRAAWAAATDGHGYFSLITDSNQKAIDALKKDYPKTKEDEVLVLNVKNAPGEIAQITDKLSQANLNINYLYTTYFDNQPALILSTDDNKKAYNLFQ
jgi:hypothetical protein